MKRVLVDCFILGQHLQHKEQAAVPQQQANCKERQKAQVIPSPPSVSVAKVRQGSRETSCKAPEFLKSCPPSWAAFKVEADCLVYQKSLGLSTPISSLPTHWGWGGTAPDFLILLFAISVQVTFVTCSTQQNKHCTSEALFPAIHSPGSTAKKQICTRKTQPPK